MRYKYILRIAGENLADIARVMGTSSVEPGQWALALEEGPGEPPIPFVEVFLGILEDKLGPLESIGVARDDITIWLLYEYDEQCNLELSASELKRLGNAGISLCVSCWQAPS